MRRALASAIPRSPARIATIVAAVAITLVLSYCGGSTAEIATGTPPSVPGEDSGKPATRLEGIRSGEVLAEQTIIPGDDILPMTVNISLTPDGPDPAHVFIPAGRYVQLILRNRGNTEYHYKVPGLEAEELVWKSEPADAVTREAGVSEEDHEAHHEYDMVGWRATSPAGIKPDGRTVHGYTELGSIDVMRFIPVSLGTFEVVDPLHREFSGQVTVY